MKTHNQVIKFVQNNARYFRHRFRLPSGAHGGYYAVDYSDKIYHSDDTGELAASICKDLNISTK